MPPTRILARVLAVVGALALVSGGSITGAAAPAPDASTDPLAALGALGANYNENLDHLNYRELRTARASWVRGFYALPEADAVPPEQSETLRVMRDAHSRGYKTLLSLKFPKTAMSFPRPGSPEMAAELARLDRVLPLVFGTVDIVTIGNEPFIESLPAERDERLNEFYEAVARHVVNARPAGSTTHLFMGALNRLDLPQNRTPAVERYLRFVRETPELEGVDLHPHVADEAAIQAFLDYTLPRLRPSQTFLVTEFSLVWYWQQHLTDRIPVAPPSDTAIRRTVRCGKSSETPSSIRSPHANGTTCCPRAHGSSPRSTSCGTSWTASAPRADWPSRRTASGRSRR
jgi:hypothetical protein